MNELVVLSHIAGRTVAVTAAEVRSVVDLEAVVPVPRAPAYVAGLAALRSRALTVIDTRRAIGSTDLSQGTDSRAIVVEHDGHDYALLVDDVSDVVEGEASASSVPGNYGAGWQKVARGMIETERGPALLLDPSLLLDEAAQNARIGA